MKERMTESELIRKVAKRSKVSLYNCELVYDALVKELSQCLVDGKSIQMKKFIYFDAVELPARKGRSPKTKCVEWFPPVKVVKCRISEYLKNAVKKGKIEFEDGKYII